MTWSSATRRQPPASHPNASSLDTEIQIVQSEILVRNTDSNTGFRFRLNGKTLQIYKADESVGVNVDNIFHSSSYMMTRLTK